MPAVGMPPSECLYPDSKGGLSGEISIKGLKVSEIKSSPKNLK